MGTQNTHQNFPPFLQYLHNGHTNLYVLHTFKHFNMMGVNIVFLNGDSFGGLRPIDNFFNEPYMQVLHIFLKYLWGLSFNGFKV
jgi:hypothetical protein